MDKKVRRSISINKSVNEWMQNEAKRCGISVNALISMVLTKTMLNAKQSDENQISYFVSNNK